MFVANDWHTSLLPFYLQVRVHLKMCRGGSGVGVGWGGACHCAQQHRFQCTQLALFITSHLNWPDLDSLAANLVLPKPSGSTYLPPPDLPPMGGLQCPRRTTATMASSTLLAPCSCCTTWRTRVSPRPVQLWLSWQGCDCRGMQPVPHLWPCRGSMDSLRAVHFVVSW